MRRPFGLFIILIFFGCASSDLTRSVDFATCLDSFDIHEDKIIRTEDSKAIGAKYLNERDVSSRDDCKRLCCETESCDVFVFEEKNPGSCYLFQCGPSEYFKCKFTKHQNYTSAVLALNRQLTELESQIKLTQHEHELTKLRDPPKPDIPLPTAYKATTQAPKNKEIAEFPLDNGISQKKGCRKYQFECHTSKECIAIYNACDGITQCADGSDEAPELGCPTPSTAAPVKISATQPPVRIHDPPPESYPGVEGRRVGPSVNELQNQWQQRQQFVEDQQVQNPNSLAQSLPVGANPRTAYGREGEMMNYRQDPQFRQYHPGQSQIFTHKGNGLVPQSEHYQHPYSPPEMTKNNYNEQTNELPKYYYENTQYRVFPQNQPPANWQPGRRTHEGPVQIEDVPNRVDPQIPPNSPDYYYEESYRNRQSYSQGQQPGYRQMNPAYPEKAPNHQVDGSKTLSAVQKTVTTVAPTSAPKEIAAHEVKNSHVMKVEKLSAESKIKEVSFEEIDGHSTNPSGAILSLTLGLCITVIMVVLVGCRMRMVRRRMRRGGKSSYAHDADFLVNGMYL